MRIRTEYSTGMAYGKLPNVFKRLQELEWEYCPITDRMSTFGFVEWAELCAKHGRKPIFGVELGVSTNPCDKRPHVSYLTFVATENIQDINAVVSKATSQPGALLTYEDVRNITGCTIFADNRAKLDLLDKEKVGVALSPSTPIGYYREAKKRGFTFIASSDNVFNIVSDCEKYRVLLGRQSSNATFPQHILSMQEWDAAVSHFDNQDRIDAVYNRAIIEKGCTATLNRARLPKIDAPENLWDLCMAGMVRLGVPLAEPYKGRLIHELTTIADKGFEDYFYIVAELMQWARQRMIVAPGRGSSAGSLVCYLLGITSVDPIKYDLLFERFLDITRDDLPDIDMDFDDTRRHLVFEHLEATYGKERIAKIANVTRFRAKSIINTAAASLRIPIWLSGKAAEELDAHSDADARALTPFADTFKLGEYSSKLVNEYPEISLVFEAEFHAKNFSVHAAGAVITDDSISRYVAIDSRNDTAMADKNTAERLGLLKLDLLGLSQLSVFARTLELIGVDQTNAFLEQIPMDDQEAFDIINQQKYSGVFQIGRALINLFKHFGVNKLEDIVAVTSLARPGPLSSGGASRWVHRRVGLSAVEYAHPCLEPILKSTYGEVVYQEQLMQIARDIGGMSIADVSNLRRAVAKSKGAEVLRPYGDKFKLGAERFGFVGAEVNSFWDDLCGFGSYSFNRSHAVAYSIITYYCCWFKAFYPVQFAAATLDAQTDPTRQITLLRELHVEGIGYVPIDPDTSTDRWTIKDGTEGKKILVGPLTSVKGIGPAGLAEIIEARASGQPLKPGLAKRLAEAQTPIDSLTPVATALARCVPDLRAVNIVTKPTPISQVDKGDHGDVLIIGLLKAIKKKDRNDAESVARRNGRRIQGNATALNLTFADDSGVDIIAIIGPEDYEAAAASIIERGSVDKAIYAVKGSVPERFRMLSVKGIRYLCNIDDGLRPITDDWFTQPQVSDGEDYFTSKEQVNGGTEQSV